jgi:hypothetical protein
MIEKSVVEILYLPPDSPDLIPGSSAVILEKTGMSLAKWILGTIPTPAWRSLLIAMSWTYRLSGSLH